MLNTITTDKYTLTISKANRPYSNSFTQKKAKVIDFEGTDIIRAIVTCTQRSKEAGREYLCFFNTAGKMLCCETIN